MKQFNELSAQELFEIYKLRVSVFVVDQSCPYQEVDDADKAAYHLVLRDEDGIPHIKNDAKIKKSSYHFRYEDFLLIYAG